MQDIIAVIFDFDDTLAPDSTSSLLDSLGIDVKAFWADRVHALIRGGWDPVPAYLYSMLQASNSGDPALAITREKLIRCGRRIQLYNGATRIFDRLRKHVQSVNPAIGVEFYLVSSGLRETLTATRIASQFKDIWACDFEYDAEGRILFPRNLVSFTDKTRYIFHISKGIVGPEARGKPFDVNLKLSPERLRVPISQMIFVGDGYTDIPCFSLIRKNDGVAIGVYDGEDRARWGRAWGFIEDGRVSNLVPADYGKSSALTNSLLMAIDSMARKIELRRNTYQG
ncbi:MAG: HAD family hydrolase [Gammaproteobacteria bacterium]